MAYQQNNKKFNNNRNNGARTDRPKNKTMTFNLVMSGVTPNDRTYDVNRALALLETLQDNDTFNTLSVPVNISRAIIENDNTRRGTVGVGFIKGLSISDLTVDVTIFGKYASEMSNVPSLNFVPRMLIKDECVVTFLGFDLVTAE